jgi:hypothetical protein
MGFSEAIETEKKRVMERKKQNNRPGVSFIPVPSIARDFVVMSRIVFLALCVRHISGNL